MILPKMEKKREMGNSKKTTFKNFSTTLQQKYFLFHLYHVWGLLKQDKQ